jgi:hypothetical protein
MWPEKSVVLVCLFAAVALAHAMAGPSEGQGSGTGTEAPSDYDNPPQPSSACVLYRKLSLRQVSAIPSVYDVRDEPCRRFPCAL